MRTLKIDTATNDLALDAQNNFNEIAGEEEENQSIRLLLSTNTGEWFLNVLHGLNYEHFHEKQFDEERARIALIEALSQDPRVQEVVEVSFNFDQPNRNLVVHFKAKMTSGNIVKDVINI